MADEKPQPAETPKDADKPKAADAAKSGGFVAKIVATVVAPIVVAVAAKWLDPAILKGPPPKPSVEPPVVVSPADPKPAEPKPPVKTVVDIPPPQPKPAPPEPKGKLVVYADDPALRVTLKQEGRVVVDRTPSREIDVKPGTYDVEVTGAAAGLHASPKRVPVQADATAEVGTWRSKFAWPVPELRTSRIKAPKLPAKPTYEETFQAAPKASFKAGPLPKGGERVYEGGKYVLKIPARGNLFGLWPSGSTYPDFACQVTARVVQNPATEWAVHLAPVVPTGDAPEFGIAINGDGELSILPTKRDKNSLKTAHGFRVGPLVHPAIKAKGEFNALLFVFRDAQLELYVNGVAVCDPVSLPVPATSATIVRLHGHAPDKADAIEFKQAAVWPAKDLPTPKSREAIPVK